MGQLIVLGSDCEPEADAFIGKLGQMQKEHVLGLQDLVKVTRTPDKVAVEIEGTKARVIKTSLSDENEAKLRDLGDRP